MVRCKSPVNLKAQETVLRLKPLAQAIALLMVAGNAHAATAFTSSGRTIHHATRAGPSMILYFMPSLSGCGRS
jgi:hypothetical protein